jgi:hypothetical protein
MKIKERHPKGKSVSVQPPAPTTDSTTTTIKVKWFEAKGRTIDCRSADLENGNEIVFQQVGRSQDTTRGETGARRRSYRHGHDGWLLFLRSTRRQCLKSELSEANPRGSVHQPPQRNN